MKLVVFWDSIIGATFDDGCCVLVGNRPWPTKKPHFVYSYWTTP